MTFTLKGGYHQKAVTPERALLSLNGSYFDPKWVGLPMGQAV